MRNRPSIAPLVIAAVFTMVYYKMFAFPVGFWIMRLLEGQPASVAGAFADAASFMSPSMSRGLGADLARGVIDACTILGLLAPVLAGSIVLAVAWAVGKLAKARAGRTGSAA